MKAILANWRTTLIGLCGILVVAIPPIQQWLQTTTKLNATSILAVVLAVAAAFTADAHKTP